MRRTREPEVVLALLAGVAAFVIAALVSSAARSHLPGVVVVALLLGAVVVVAHYGGVRYGLPVGIASVLAFDWYFLPPLRALDEATRFVLALFLLVSVAVGELASRTRRRAAAAEEARGRLADEHAALRRVATLIARQEPPAEVFANVAEEARLLLGVDITTLVRFEPDGTATLIGGSWRTEVVDGVERLPVPSIGTRLPMAGDNVPSLVHRTGRPVQLDDYTKVTGPIGAYGSGLGIRSAVGTPIVVDGRLWGAMVASSRRQPSLPAGAESRIREFTELVATAIGNVEAQSGLAESGARIAAAAGEERRRVIRDLHDGAQQRLVHTVITLKLARSALEADADRAPALVEEALGHAEAATAELRELAHGFLPSVLTSGGLRAGVDALAARMPVPVDVGVSVEWLPPAIEATAYFIVAEALTNVAKHAQAQRAEVTARVEDGTLRIGVRDDGVGGARPEGSGLRGLRDRVGDLDGSLEVEVPAGGGTLITASIPVTGDGPSVSRNGKL
jgi:signal transduction histidine kinase